MYNQKLLESALYKVEITIPGKGKIVDLDNVDRETAMKACVKVVDDYKDDEIVQTYLAPCLSESSFGFRGFGGAGGYDFTISATAPFIKNVETGVTCPHRMQSPGPWKDEEGLDSWEKRGDDLCCSFCGSIKPESLIELVKERGIGVIDISTKSYKFYLNRPEIPNAGFGAIKYYRWHDTTEFIAQLRELVNQKPSGV